MKFSANLSFPWNELRRPDAIRAAKARLNPKTGQYLSGNLPLLSPGLALAGIEVAHMIRNGQFDLSEQSGFTQFAALAG